MEPVIILTGLMGAAVATLLRIWNQGVKPDEWLVVVASLFGQVVLAICAVWILEPTTKLQAAAIGYAAPEILTRVLGGVAGRIDRGEDEVVRGSTYRGDRSLKSRSVVQRWVLWARH